MEWTVLEKNDFEVSEASDGSGKIISIPVCGCIHHVVSYKAWARPSQGIELRPELISVLRGLK